MGTRKPVAHEILAHGEAQAADDHHAQPPIIEDDRARHEGLVIAVPVNDERQYQCRQADRLDDGNQRIIAKIAHHCSVHAETNKQRNGYHRGDDK